MDNEDVGQLCRIFGTGFDVSNGRGRKAILFQWWFLTGRIVQSQFDYARQSQKRPITSQGGHKLKESAGA